MSKRGREPGSLYDLAARKVVKLGAVDTLRQMVDWAVFTMDQLLKDILLLSGYPTTRITYKKPRSYTDAHGTTYYWPTFKRLRKWAGPRARYNDNSIGSRYDARTVHWHTHFAVRKLYNVHEWDGGNGYFQVKRYVMEPFDYDSD
jgi:hypothetical protein